FLLVLLSVVVLFATAVRAIAGPGDPRLVTGILEGPPAVSNEPFIVVRGDDGVLYYVAVGAARHDASLTAGGRVAVLGLEGRSAHEINALGIGAGESVEAALGNLQGARPSPTVAAPPPPVASTPPPSPVRSAAVSPPPARRSTVEVTTPAAVPASSTDERRWTEISGVVESLVGRTLILRSDEGRVAVDLSSLSQNLDRTITPGAHVRVYGTPVEIRFKAMGFFDPGTRP